MDTWRDGRKEGEDKNRNGGKGGPMDNLPGLDGRIGNGSRVWFQSTDLWSDKKHLFNLFTLLYISGLGSRMKII